MFPLDTSIHESTRKIVPPAPDDRRTAVLASSVMQLTGDSETPRRSYLKINLTVAEHPGRDITHTSRKIIHQLGFIESPTGKAPNRLYLLPILLFKAAGRGEGIIH